MTNGTLRIKVSYRLVIAFLGMLLISSSFSSYAQEINGCVLQEDQWQILILNEDSGSKTLDFMYNPCNLDLLNNVYLNMEIENNSPVELVADIGYYGPISYKYNEGRHIIPAQSTKEMKLILYRGMRFLPAEVIIFMWEMRQDIIHRSC